MRTIYILPAILVLLLVKTTVKAQNIVNAGDLQTIYRNKIISRLSVGSQKADNIASVVNYRRNEILELIKDKTMDARQKDQLLKALFEQRNNKIDSVLTPEQKRMMIDTNNQPIKKAIQYRLDLLKKIKKEATRKSLENKALPINQNK
jgi:hypothetical protein